jgi:hypothetical protein
MHKGVIRVVKMVQSVNNNMSYIILRDHWHDITVLNVCAKQRMKLKIQRAALMWNQEWIFSHYPKHYMKVFFDISLPKWVEEIFSNHQM